MDLKVKKFLIFEWRMFLLLGVFCPAAMFLPLSLIGFIENNKGFGKIALILWGLYLGYLGVRVVFLFFKSLIWAYLISNFLFTSEREKIIAEEWLTFNLLFSAWFVSISYLIYVKGISLDRRSLFLTAIFILIPYVLYLAYRLIAWFLRPFLWRSKS
ncbi:MAG: hypothetical protein HQL21_06090 [Candidatus Omnitrophica bacterium]|nr:hypothetical protein [Candidatus Omnitrophota bacterium]